MSAANLVGAGENRVDMLEIPGKGRCYVYLARSVQYSTVQYVQYSIGQYSTVQ